MPRDVRRRDAVVELRGGKLLVGPLAAGGEADRAATVVGDHHVRGVVGVDPEVVEVAMGAVVDDFVGGAAVGRAEEGRVLHVDDVLVVMVGVHVRVVERPLPDPPLVVDELPAVAPVVRAEEAAVVVLEEGIDAARVRGRHRQADLADDAVRGHAGVAGDLGPGGAAVDRFEHAAARPAGGHRVLLAEGLPERRVDHVRVVAVECDVDRPGALVPEEDALPCVATVGRLEDAALLAGDPVLPERRDVDNGWIGRVDADRGDAVRLGEPDVLPGRARVAAAVDAVARKDIAANARLAHPDEDEVGVGFGHRDRADRGGVDLEIGDGEPVFAAVGRLPEAAAGGAEVGFEGAADDAAGGDGAAAAVRAEVAPGVGGEEGGGEGVVVLGEEGAGELGSCDRKCDGCDDGSRCTAAHRVLLSETWSGVGGQWREGQPTGGGPTHRIWTRIFLPFAGIFR